LGTASCATWSARVRALATPIGRFAQGRVTLRTWLCLEQVELLR